MKSLNYKDLFFILFFGFAIYMLLLLNKKNNDHSKRNESLLKKIDNISGMYKHQLLNSNIFHNQTFDDDLPVFDSDGVKLKLNEILKTKETIILRLMETNCRSCISECLSKVDLSDEKIKNNVIILIVAKNNVSFKSFLNDYSLKGQKCYYFPYNLKADIFNYPYFFSLNIDLEIKNIFFPEKEIPEFTDVYLRGIKPIIY